MNMMHYYNKYNGKIIEDHGSVNSVTVVTAANDLYVSMAHELRNFNIEIIRWTVDSDYEATAIVSYAGALGRIRFVFPRGGLPLELDNGNDFTYQTVRGFPDNSYGVPRFCKWSDLPEKLFKMLVEELK